MALNLKSRFRFHAVSDLKIPEWSDRYRRLPSATSAMPGQWKTSHVEAFRGAMIAFDDPHVKILSVCSAVQMGKTELLLGIIGRTAQFDPAPMLLVEPKEDAAAKFTRERLAPMIRECPELRAKFDPRSRMGDDSLSFKSYSGGVADEFGDARGEVRPYGRNRQIRSDQGGPSGSPCGSPMPHVRRQCQARPRLFADQHGQIFHLAKLSAIRPAACMDRLPELRATIFADILRQRRMVEVGQRRAFPDDGRDLLSGLQHGPDRRPAPQDHHDRTRHRMAARAAVHMLWHRRPDTDRMGL
jgi:hypothetical protein